jgi:hypothetical protein
LGDPLKGNLLLLYKPLHLEAQQVSTRIEVRRHHASRTTSIQEGEHDKDVPSIDTSAAPTAEHIQGPITRARAKQLNYQVLSFFGTLSHIYENMMVPKSDMFVTLRNDGPSMDERDKHWSMIVHEDGSKRLRTEEDVTSGDVITSKPP